MFDDEKLVETFWSGLSRYKRKNIVLYMNGNDMNFAFLINALTEYHIIGIITKFSSEKNILGYPVLTHEELSKGDCDVIIIITSFEYLESVRRRLSPLCLLNNIELFSLYGERLSLDSIDMEYHIYFEISTEDVVKKIDDNEVIVFSILQVLLCENFIYKFTDENNLNINLLEKRHAGIGLYNYALRQGKTVILVEDSKASKTYWEDILTKFNISGYTELFLSDEYNSTILGNLLGEVKKEVESKKVLYIGTSRNMDVESAVMNQMDVCKLYSVSDMLEISVYKNLLLDMEDSYNRLENVLFLNRIFNSPFSLFQTDGKGRIDTAYDIGYLIFGPYITRFMFWFIQKMQDDNVQHVLFASRDGYLIKKLYDIAIVNMNLKQMPNSDYFYTSRIVCTIINIYCFDDIQKAASVYFNGTFEEMLKYRFLLKENEITPYVEADYENIWHYFLLHAETIIKKADCIRKNYEKYINKFELPSAFSRNIAFFDFVASGSSQLQLENTYGTKLKGYYFYRLLSDDSEKQKLAIESFYPYDVELEDNSLFMEFLCTSPEPVVCCFDDKGNPIFSNELRTDEEIGFSLELQKGVSEYFEKVTSCMSCMNMDMPIEGIKLPFLSFLNESKTMLEIDVFNDLLAKDEFYNIQSKIKNLYIL